MKFVDIAEATATLAEYTRDVQSAPVVVTVGGKPVAALVPVDHVDIESLSLGTNPDFLAIIERSRARREAEGGISKQVIRERLELGE